MDFGCLLPAILFRGPHHLRQWNPVLAKCDCGCVIKWRVAALVLFCCRRKSFKKKTKNCLPFRGMAWNFYFSLCSLPSHFCFVILEGFFFTPLLSSVVQHFHGFIFIFIPSLSTLLAVPLHLVLLHIPDVLSRSVVSSICSPCFPPSGLALPVTAPHPRPPNAPSLRYCHERFWTVTKTTRRMKMETFSSAKI